MSDREVPVLIVGGSLVGLSTSLFLGWHGVPHLLVERHQGTAIHPRAASFHQRTMEMFRSVGLHEAVMAAAEREFVQNGAILAVESLAGKELAHFYRSFNEGVENLSATSRIFITQVGLEPVLRDRALELGAEHRYHTELVDLAVTAEGVQAVLRSRSDGSEERVRAQYLVAADGAHSPVRERLGIAMAGRGDFADCVTIYFRADVRELIGDRNLSVVYVNQPGLLAFFRFAITADRGFLAVFRSDTQLVVGAMDVDQAADHVRRALGVGPEVEVEIDNMQRWSAAAAWAERFAEGPVFLAGDAAHVMPPTGGFGGNTGVADAYNLAWKLAAVLDGTAGADLLASYDAERRPVASSIVEQAYTRYVQRVDPTLPQDDLADPLDDASIELGSMHRSSAVVAEGAGAELDDPRTPTGRPGTRLPHLWLTRAGERVSTLDLVGRSHLLLTGPAGAAWTAAATGAAADAGVPLEVKQVGAAAGLDDAGRFADLVGIGSDGAVLVRPDGVIAWRAATAVPDPRGTLAQVLARVMSRVVPAVGETPGAGGAVPAGDVVATAVPEPAGSEV